MNKKRFEYGETDLFEWIEDNGKMISTKECVDLLNEYDNGFERLNKTNQSQYELLQEQKKKIDEQESVIDFLSKENMVLKEENRKQDDLLVRIEKLCDHRLRYR